LSSGQNQFPGILGLLSVSRESPSQDRRKRESGSDGRGKGETMMRRMTDGDENPTKTIMPWDICVGYLMMLLISKL
jgi:hypothetical protein